MRHFLALLLLLLPSLSEASIAFVQTGTGTQGTSSVAPIMPATNVAIGDLFVMCVVNKPTTAEPSTPSNWTALSNNQGTGDDGDSTHAVQVTLFYRIATSTGGAGGDPGDHGSITTTITGGTASYGNIVQYRNSTLLWSVSGAQGGDNTFGANYSALMNTDPDLTTDDFVVACNGKSNATVGASSEALAAAGVSFDTGVERVENGTAFGDDAILIMSEHPVLNGPSSGNLATMTYSNAASIIGGTALLRLRQSGGTPPGPGCTTTLTSLAQATVQGAINSAETGATICFNASTDDSAVTWTTTTNLSPAVTINKGITLQGNTVCTGDGSVATPVSCVDHTIINDGTNTGAGSDLILMTGTNARITGISFKDLRPDATTDSGPTIRMKCSSCRFDHNSVIDTISGYITGNSGPVHWPSHGISVLSYNGANVLGSQLIDHNYFGDLDNAIVATSEAPGEVAPRLGSAAWSIPRSFGDALAVYVEDNNIVDTQHHNGAWDAYWGATIVYRNNRSVNTNMGGHGFDSADRSTLRQEVYRNIVTSSSDVMPEWFGTRGGGHHVFLNTISVTGTGVYTNHMNYRYYRSHPLYDGFVGTGSLNKGQCGEDAVGDPNASPVVAPGSLNIRDGNTTAQHGYPCRDQPGFMPGANATLDWPYIIPTTGSNLATFSQVLTPTYSWGNDFKGAAPTITNVNINAPNPGKADDNTRVQTYHVLNNRELYVEVASFDGTAGTGQGTHAARPATCTTGVAYWETDTGEWDSTNGATADGRLFKCTSTNTWTLYYTPYTYPHPLQTATYVPPLPQAPTGLRTIGATSATSCTLVWLPSALAGQLGYHVYHGTSPGVYDTSRQVTAATAAATHTPLTQQTFLLHQAGTHYFSVTAYNADGDTAYATEVICTSTGVSRTAASLRGGH